MSDSTLNSEDLTPPFQPYQCSLGAVIGYENNTYLIAISDGRTIGIRARGDLSPKNIESDILNQPPPLPPPVPDFVRTAQLRQWLIDNNLLSAIESKLDSPRGWPTEKERLKAKARFEYEVNVVRYDPLVVALGSDLGFSDQKMDEAFRQIAQYK